MNIFQVIYIQSDTLQMLMVKLVNSDYSRLRNGVLLSLPAYLMCQLQSVLNAAARLICRLRNCDHITDALVKSPLVAGAAKNILQTGYYY